MKKIITTLSLLVLSYFVLAQTVEPNLLVHHAFDSTYLSEAEILALGNNSSGPKHSVYLDGSPAELPTVTGNYSDAMTISFWAKPSSSMTSGVNHTLFSQRSGCNHNHQFEVLLKPGTNEMTFLTRTIRNGSDKAMSFSITYTPDVWKKYTFTYDDTGGLGGSYPAKGYAYINGVWANNNSSQNVDKDGFPNTSTNINSFTGGTLRVSSSVCSSSNGYVGGIRDLNIYSTQIKNTFIYNAYQTNNDAQYNPDYTAYLPETGFIDRSTTSTPQTALMLTGQVRDLGTPAISTTAGEGYTFSVWLKPDVGISGHKIIFGKRSVCSNVNSFQIICRSSEDKIQAVFRTNASVTASHMIDYTPGVWQQIVFTVDLSTSTISGYNNGTFTSDASINVNAIKLDYTGQLELAKDVCNFDSYTGGIDELKIYSVPLTATQVTSGYNNSIVTNVFDMVTNDKVLAIYPNPATSTIYVAEGEVQIFDQLGELLLSETSNGQIDVSSLDSGIYFVTQNGKRSKLIKE